MAALLSSVTPLVLLVFNRDWMFTTEGYLDPWHYVGLFREYLNPSYSPGAYKLARLPWILVGFLAHHVLSPVAAAYVLHGSFLILTSLALFAGLYALFGRVSLAGVVATMLGFYTHAHGSGGWDYHNTAAGAFYLLAFMLLALPGSVAGRRISLMVAGATAALAVHSNITLVNFLPVLILVHLQTVRVRAGRLPGLRNLFTRFAWSTLGAVLVTVALGLVNVMAGREFLFFAVLTRIVVQYVGDPRYQAHWKPPPGWALTAAHLSLPAAVFIVGALTLVMNRRRVRDWTRDIRVSLVAQFLVMGVVWTAWEMAGQLGLSWNYFAYVLIPSCFIAMGGLFAMGWPKVLERHWLATILLTGTLATLLLAGIADPSIQIAAASVASKIAVIGCVVFVTGLAAYVWRPGAITAIVAIIVFAIGNRFVSTNSTAYLAQDPCKIQDAVYAAVVESGSVLGQIDNDYLRIRTWFDQPEEIYPTTKCAVSLGSMGGSITTMAFVQYVTPPWPMPNVDSVPESAIRSVTASNGLLAIITARQENVDAWIARLRKLDLEHREVASRRIRLLDSEFSIRAWEILQKPPAVDFGAPIIAVTDRTPGEVNVYGTPKGTVVKDQDRVLFRPTDSRDHLSYPFAMFAARHSTWARVTVQFPPSASNVSSCRLVVQNPGMTVLAAIPCETSTRFLKLPDETPGLRVYLADTTHRQIVMPQRIEVALSK